MSETRWDIPPDWIWTTAGEIARIVGGGTPNASDPANFSEDGVPWVTPADLTGYQGVYIGRGRRHLSDKGLKSSGATLMPAGSVLFSSRAPVGYCAIAENEISTNQGFKNLVLSEDVQPEFIRYYLLASTEYAESLASGTTFKELSGARTAQLAVPLAPLPEQRRIVAKLDSLTARTKSTRDELGRIPLLIEHYKQAILEKAFTGELTADWRRDHSCSSSIDALIVELSKKRRTAWELDQKRSRNDSGVSRSRYKVPEKLMMPEFLGILPENWRWLPVDALAWKVVDGVHKTPNYVESGVPFVTVRNLTAGNGIDLTNLKYVSQDDHQRFSRRANPEKGDILISKDGTLGVVRAIKEEPGFSIFVSVAMVKPAMKEMTPYLEWAFKAPQVQEQMVGVGTGLQHIHLTDLRKDFIPVAPIEEQREIVDRLEAAMERLNVLAMEREQAARLLDHLDHGLLARAFRGELVPQDPHDEPAGKLLERIRAARARPAGRHAGAKR